MLLFFYRLVTSIHDTEKFAKILMLLCRMKAVTVLATTSIVDIWIIKGKILV
jgi:hypothetical protein